MRDNTRISIRSAPSVLVVAMLLMLPVIWHHCVQAAGGVSAIVPCPSEVTAEPPCHDDALPEGIDICCATPVAVSANDALTVQRPEVPSSVTTDDALLVIDETSSPAHRPLVPDDQAVPLRVPLNVLYCSYLC